MLSYTVPATKVQRNQSPKAWDELTAVEKRFPRIANDLCRLWGSSDIDQYVDRLLLDDRGDRMGFPIDVLDELMFLGGIRWRLNHLCGTLIESTSAEAFSYATSATESCNPDSATWVLI